MGSQKNEVNKNKISFKLVKDEAPPMGEIILIGSLNDGYLRTARQEKDGTWVRTPFPLPRGCIPYVWARIMPPKDNNSKNG